LYKHRNRQSKTLFLRLFFLFARTKLKVISWSQETIEGVKAPLIKRAGERKRPLSIQGKIIHFNEIPQKAINFEINFARFKAQMLFHFWLPGGLFLNGKYRLNDWDEERNIVLAIDKLFSPIRGSFSPLFFRK